MALEDYIKALREASQTTGFAECFIETGEAPTHHLKEWMLEDWGFERRTLSSRTFTLILLFLLRLASLQATLTNTLSRRGGA